MRVEILKTDGEKVVYKHAEDLELSNDGYIYLHDFTIPRTFKQENTRQISVMFFGEDAKQQMIDELSSMSLQELQTAYAYAKCYLQDGVDITQKWQTAVEQKHNLQQAYHRGYHDALERCHCPAQQIVDDIMEM